MRIVGIDPGKTGAVALINGQDFVSVADMPVVRVGKKEIVSAPALAALIRSLEPDMVVVEQVSSRPGEGVASAFQFGRGYGVIIGVAAALGLRLEYATPPAWKSLFHLNRKDKDEARHVVQSRFPDRADLFSRKMDVGRADAVLIGIYGAHAYG